MNILDKIFHRHVYGEWEQVSEVKVWESGFFGEQTGKYPIKHKYSYAATCKECGEISFKTLKT